MKTGFAIDVCLICCVVQDRMHSNDLFKIFHITHLAFAMLLVILGLSQSIISYRRVPAKPRTRLCYLTFVIEILTVFWAIDPYGLEGFYPVWLRLLFSETCTFLLVLWGIICSYVSTTMSFAVVFNAKKPPLWIRRAYFIVLVSFGIAFPIYILLLVIFQRKWIRTAGE